MHINIECKALCSNLEEKENKLKTLNPKYIGEDHQIDTYFNTHNGRLKLREGNIENALIQYNRNDAAQIKQSDVQLYKTENNTALKAILIATLGIKKIVDKTRRIYFIDNVKFHFDTVKDLGSFIEIEAIEMEPTHNASFLQEQVNYYVQFLDIANQDFLTQSYSDLVH
jgi:adenylate cyclase, class 2